jgi:hypothetical protein
LTDVARVSGALLVTLALTVAACGRGGEEGVATLGGSSDETSRSPEPSQDADEAFLEFAECMREHGIDMPDPATGEGGLTFEVGEADAEEFREAEAACRHLIEDVVEEGVDQIPPEEQERLQEQLLAFAQCMREQGIDFPDPTFGEGGFVEVGPGEGVDPTDPEFREAEQACRDLLPEFQPGGGSGGP